MKIDIAKLLQRYTSTLFTEVAPALGANHLAGSVFLMGMGLHFAVQQIEDSVDWLVTENQTMRALFADAERWIPDAALAVRLRTAAATQNSSLRMGELNHSHDELTALLIELQTMVEDLGTPPARAMERKILVYLKGFADRRRLVPLPMAGG